MEEIVNELNKDRKNSDWVDVSSAIDWYERNARPYLDPDIIQSNDAFLKFAKTTKKATLPKFAHEGDACFDISIIIDKEFVPENLWDNSKYIPEIDYMPDKDTKELVETFYIEIPPHCSAVFDTGLKCEFSKDYVLRIFPRSSTGIKNGLSLSNGTGIIDSSYKGNLKVALTNNTNSIKRVYDGDRVAQGCLDKVIKTKIVEISEQDLSKTERGEGGIGSTGR